MHGKIAPREGIVKSKTDSQIIRSVETVKQRKQTKQKRIWSQIAKLAREALDAFDAGKPKDARERMKAIYGLAVNADGQGERC